jgi:hypothetical protein
MKPWDSHKTGIVKTSSSVILVGHTRQLVRGREVGLINRVMGIDCMLADIEMEMQRLQDERTHLRLVRKGLTDMLAAGSLHKLVS